MNFLPAISNQRSTISRRGFTLIELLVVIVIIALLAAVIFVALDPARRFADSRNARRWNDVNNILTAVHVCIVDKMGILADCDANFSKGMAEIQLGTAADCGVGCAAGLLSCLDLSTSLSAYLANIPYDPNTGDAAHTRYTLEIDSNGIVYIRACDEEAGTGGTPVIEVAR